MRAVALTEVERSVILLRRPQGFACCDIGRGRDVRGQALHSPSLVLRGAQGGRHGQ